MTLKLGYMRVSTDAKEDGREQTLDQQKEILMEWGVKEENIYQDRISGSKNITEGEGWKRLQAFIDTCEEKKELELCAVKFDRISRDFLQLQNTIATLNAQGIGITAEGYKRFIAKDTMDLMRIAMESFGAALYRERVRKATSEKLRYLRDVKGVKLGPPRKLTEKDLDSITYYRSQGYGAQRIAKKLSEGRLDKHGNPTSVSKNTVLRAMEKHGIN